MSHSHVPGATAETMKSRQFRTDASAVEGVELDESWTETPMEV
jgi:hypothetical protein